MLTYEPELSNTDRFSREILHSRYAGPLLLLNSIAFVFGLMYRTYRHPSQILLVSLIILIVYEEILLFIVTCSRDHRRGLPASIPICSLNISWIICNFAFGKGAEFAGAFAIMVSIKCFLWGSYWKRLGLMTDLPSDHRLSLFPPRPPLQQQQDDDDLPLTPNSFRQFYRSSSLSPSSKLVVNES
jgi:hypothetical protein